MRQNQNKNKFRFMSQKLKILRAKKFGKSFKLYSNVIDFIQNFKL